MAVSKVILNGTTLIDVTQDTVDTVNLLSGETATKNSGVKVTGAYVPPTFSTQSKTVSPSTSQQTVSPDTGYDGLSSVTVNAISPTKAAATYTPTTTDQSIASGQWLTGAQTIKGDSNLVAANIASGVTIFGVTGTHMGGTDVSDTTATASDVLSGKYFYTAAGVKTQGTITVYAGAHHAGT